MSILDVLSFYHTFYCASLLKKKIQYFTVRRRCITTAFRGHQDEKYVSRTSMDQPYTFLHRTIQVTSADRSFSHRR